MGKWEGPLNKNIQHASVVCRRFHYRPPCIPLERNHIHLKVPHHLEERRPIISVHGVVSRMANVNVLDMQMRAPSLASVNPISYQDPFMLYRPPRTRLGF